jgi:hypothetical protein
MGIYLPDMEMPISCAKCKLFGEYGCPFIGAVGYALTRGKRNEDCPLVPVPAHGRLIDADALKVSLAFAEKTAEWAVPALRAVLMVIDEMPTVIPADPCKEKGE